MSNIKPITINPALFKISNKKNKTSKAANNTIIKPSILKKELLARIKSHRNNKLKENYSQSSPSSPSSPISQNTKLPIKIDNKSKISKIENDKDADDFSESIDFLKSLSKKKQHNLTKKSNFPLEKTNTNLVTSISFPEMSSTQLTQSTQPTQPTQPTILQNTPVYGCLKNGTLPTFREMKNKTIKKSYSNSSNSNSSNSDSNSILSINEINPITLESDVSNVSNVSNVSDKSESIVTLVNDLVPININDFGSPNISPTATTLEATTPEKCLTKSKTIKYTLGKKDNRVSVLIKNAHTRKNIVDSIARIKETKIADMKKYLKQHNLLKSGSKCPPDVIKKIYEQSFLCGIIKNNNKDNIIQNFLNN